MWINLYGKPRAWYERLWIRMRWNFSGMFRKGLTPNGLMAWYRLNLRCRKLNKMLLEEAHKSSHSAPYPDPTPKDVEEFVQWAQAHGIIEIKE